MPIARASSAARLVGLLAIGSLACGCGARARISPPASRRPPAEPVAHVALGVTTEALALNEYRPWRGAALAQVRQFERQAQQHAGIVMWFDDWAHNHFDAAQARAVARLGAIPEITWEPWNGQIRIHRAQPAYTLASIIDGRHDAYIERFAAAAKAYGGPLLLRFAQEMNGPNYPWSETANTNLRGQFVTAWRHIHALFKAIGARNVRFVWTPVVGGNYARYFPGAAYVDVIGLSGFNGGTAERWTGWRSFTAIYDGELRKLESLAPGKPVQIAEVGSAESGGSKAAWIAGMWRNLAGRRDIRSLIWFDLRKQTDWRIDSSAAAQRAFAAGARDARYG